MDPNDTLKELRRVTEFILKEGGDLHMQTAALNMAECFQALDDWLKKGGFLPKDWDHDRMPNK